jgi:hypothetical protein
MYGIFWNALGFVNDRNAIFQFFPGKLVAAVNKHLTTAYHFNFIISCAFVYFKNILEN